MKRTLSAFLLILTLASSGPAAAMPPSLLVWADSGMRQAIQVPLKAAKDGTFFLDKFEYATSDYRIRLSDVLLDPDPSISYVLAVADFGAPSAFSISFLTPIVPTGAPNEVNAWIGGGLLDLTGNGIALTPTHSALQVSMLGTPLPATNMGVDVGQAFAAGPRDRSSLYAYGLYSSGLIPGPGPGPWTGLGASIAFQFSGGGDMAALAGHVGIQETIVPVPAPSSAALVGLGLLGGLAGWLRRRRTA